MVSDISLRTMLVGATATVALIGAFGAGYEVRGDAGTEHSPTVRMITVSGLVFTTLHIGMFGDKPGAVCREAQGFSRVAVGTAVEVTDSSGQTLGVGRLEPGTIQAAPNDQTTSPEMKCALQFAFQVPAGRSFYRVQVGQYSPQPFQESELGQPVVLYDDAAAGH